MYIICDLMPRRSFRIVKKSGSFKKRRGAIGKKSKAQRKRGSRRRIKMIVGGAAWLNEQTDLSVVWNSLFYERVKTQFTDFFPRINPTDLETPMSGSDIKKVLFVIDMQKDFVDRVYQRNATHGDKHPVYINLPQEHKPPGTDEGLSGGNFAVTDAIQMLGGSKTDAEAIENFSSQENAESTIQQSEFLKHIKAALESSDYTHVIFSRDYHPVGHCSFNNRWFSEQTLCEGCDDGGNFPAHCVQGFEGSKFLPEIEYLIKKYGGTKAKVVFKGVYKQCDSFTAVNKTAIDSNASNVKKTNNCSTISGAYLAPTEFDKFGVDKFVSTNLSPLTYKTESNIDLNLSDATHIEVCGLAGDYCVRDTVVALAEMFNDTKIILLGDYTRYPTLPFFSIGILPHHNYKKYGVKKSILPILSDYDKSLILNGQEINDLPSEVDSYDNIKSHFESEYNYDAFNAYRKSRALPLLKYALLNTQFLNKDIIYYLLTKSNPTDSLKLMSSADLTTASADELVDNPFCEHFITPFQAIIEDYNSKPNIYIKMKFIGKNHNPERV